jgi:hypothetical protein
MHSTHAGVPHQIGLSDYSAARTQGFLLILGARIAAATDD